MARPRKWTKAGDVAGTGSPAPKQAALLVTDYDWLVAHGWTLAGASGRLGRVWSTYRHTDGRRIERNGATCEDVDALVRREVERQEGEANGG